MADTSPTDPAGRTLLRFITCGSVDDGKSTLIGRLLLESDLLPEDQLAAVGRDSARWGTQGDDPDLALLVDGLAAEREQGITIDVAYRYFTTARRKYIVADTPGHEQYTRNMVTGASTADAAVILVDAGKGLRTQTRRHTCLVHLLGIRRLVLAVNKMDLVGHDEAVFRRIEDEYLRFAASLGAAQVSAVPVSALRGDNVVTASAAMPWYAGPPLLGLLDGIEPTEELHARGLPMRLPVQLVLRPDPTLRAYCGPLVAGRLAPGDEVQVLPGGQRTRVERLLAMGGDAAGAVAGESVALTLTDEIDVARGDVLVAAASPPSVADQFECTVVWMHETPMLPGRPYLLKLGTRTVNAVLGDPKYRLNVDTLEHVAARTLGLNDIGVCNLSVDQPLVFEPYATLRDLGGFILIDRTSRQTLGAGLLHFALRRAHNLHPQRLDVGAAARSALMGHGAAVIWLTGLSGAGKSTVANRLAVALHARGVHTYLLDGDNVRQGLCRDLGFTDADRVENIRRIAEVARLMVDAGLVVITAFISPFRAERDMARRLVGAGRFVEVHVDVSLALAESRDPKGLYAKARRGELPHFTGIDSPYEAPAAPEVVLDTGSLDVAQAVDRVLAYLDHHGTLRL